MVPLTEDVVAGAGGDGGRMLTYADVCTRMQVRVVMEDKDLAMHADIAPSLHGVELVGDGSRIMQVC